MKPTHVMIFSTTVGQFQVHFDSAEAALKVHNELDALREKVDRYNREEQKIYRFEAMGLCCSVNIASIVSVIVEDLEQSRNFLIERELQWRQSEKDLAEEASKRGLDSDSSELLTLLKDKFSLKEPKDKFSIKNPNNKEQAV